jgi:hypothetical protein
MRALLIAAFAFSGALLAQSTRCDHINEIVQMARETSASKLLSKKIKGPDTYFANVVRNARLMELRPSRDTAISLLDLIPKGVEQEEVWLTLRDDCAEFAADVKVLGRLRDDLPRDLSRAVMLAPEKLPDYLCYSIKSVEDPHSDYAIRMQEVCRIDTRGFRNAVDELPPALREPFLNRVFDPDTCRAIKLPQPLDRPL